MIHDVLSYVINFYDCPPVFPEKNIYLEVKIKICLRLLKSVIHNKTWKGHTQIPLLKRLLKLERIAPRAAGQHRAAGLAGVVDHHAFERRHRADQAGGPLVSG